MRNLLSAAILAAACLTGAAANAAPSVSGKATVAVYQIERSSGVLKRMCQSAQPLCHAETDLTAGLKGKRGVVYLTGRQLDVDLSKMHFESGLEFSRPDTMIDVDAKSNEGFLEVEYRIAGAGGLASDTLYLGEKPLESGVISIPTADGTADIVVVVTAKY